MSLTVKKEEKKFIYVEEGSGEPIVLLHGLFGTLSNWDSVVNYFKDSYRVIIPMLPIYTMPVHQAGVGKLSEFLEEFISYMQLKDVSLAGNSLGGHVALVYALRNQSNVKRLILTGSSGLYEDSLGGSFPKRGSYEYVQERVAYTFYDPKTATKELIDEIFEAINDTRKCVKVIAIAKSAQRNNIAKEITNITIPTLLIWGLNDTITPPMVAHEFNRLISNSILRFVDKCCHAPMIEQPDKFNRLMHKFLQEYPIT